MDTRRLVWDVGIDRFDESIRFVASLLEGKEDHERTNVLAHLGRLTEYTDEEFIHILDIASEARFQ